MVTYTFRKEWYNEIKNRVTITNPYFYTENGREYVEADVDEAEFEAVSRELGWMY